MNNPTRIVLVAVLALGLTTAADAAIVLQSFATPLESAGNPFDWTQDLTVEAATDFLKFPSRQRWRCWPWAAWVYWPAGDAARPRQILGPSLRYSGRGMM